MRDVLDRLELRGDERVLDAGCGTGRVTAALVERLPRGEVVAVDGSPAMVAQARERLGDRADVRVADLLELELERPVDAILSTATFHWIADHERLFARLLGVLVPGGRLVAQCGGAGQRRRRSRPRLAASASASRSRPRWRAGRARGTSPRRPRPRSGCDGSAGSTFGRWSHGVRVEPDDPREYLGTVALGSHTERLEPALREPFVDAVIAELDEPVATTCGSTSWRGARVVDSVLHCPTALLRGVWHARSPWLSAPSSSISTTTLRP